MSVQETMGDRTGETDGTAIVWLFTLALSVGGTERTITELANGLDRDRFAVTVWTVFQTNPLESELDEDISVRSLGVTAIRDGDEREITGAVNPLMYLIAPLTFLSTVREERPVILHSFLFYDNLIARFAGLASPETVVVTGERGFHNSSRPIAQRIDRLTMGLSDSIVSNSQAGADYYAEHGFNEDSLYVVPNGRELTTYRDGSGDGVRSTFDVPADAPLVGTVGRLVERKGHFDLLAAWDRLQESFPTAHLLLVGHGPERDELAARAGELGIRSQVHFTGRRDDVPALLDAMDYFVFPSHWEGLPGAVQEAMAAGLPIVATRLSGTSELLADGETGLLVPSQDPTELGTALGQLLADPDAAATLGDRAQRVAFERYTRQRMVDQFERLYEIHAGGAAERRVAR